MQNHYNLIYREEEREMFPTLKVCLNLYPTQPFLNHSSGSELVLSLGHQLLVEFCAGRSQPRQNARRPINTSRVMVLMLPKLKSLSTGL